MFAPARRSPSLAYWLNWILASRLFPAAQSNPCPGRVIAQSSVQESSEIPPSAFFKYSGARHEIPFNIVLVDATSNVELAATSAPIATAATEKTSTSFLTTWPPIVPDCGESSVNAAVRNAPPAPVGHGPQIRIEGTGYRLPLPGRAPGKPKHT